MVTAAQMVLRFDRFELDPNTASCWADGRALSLRPKSFDVLLYLARHPGRVVSKDELIETLWPGVFVTDNSLVQCISDIRAALGDEEQAIVKTVARRGYLFAASVAEVEPAPPPEPAREAATPAPVAAIAAPGRPVAARPWQRALTIAGVGAAMALLVWTGFQRWSGTVEPAAVSSPVASDPAPNSRRMTIAVLPFAMQGTPAGDDYFADGLTEDIIDALGRFADVSVLSPKSVAPYKGKASRPEEIGRELKVRYIAEGSVRRSPERLRVGVRLTDAADGTLLWADQYDIEPDTIFAVQDNITRHITGALSVRLTNVEQARVAAKPPSSLEAYDLVLRGRDFLSRLSRSATSNARTMFERAVELDPNYATAYVGLGRVDLIAVNLGWTPDSAGTLQRAEMHARRAIGIDEFNPGAHVVLGRIYARLGEYDRAMDALKRAVALNPSNPDSHAGLGDALLWAGEIDAAVKALESAAQLDPKLSSEDLFNLGAGYFLIGKQAEAAQVFERVVARNDGNAFIHAMLAAIYAEAGREEQAARAVAEARRLNPFFDVAKFGSLFRNVEHRQKIAAALHKAGF